MLNKTKQLYDWMGAKVQSPYADFFLGFLFYLEAIFFVPTDPILVLYCIKRKNRALTYATITTAASVLGGITSYLLGLALWETFGQQIIHNKIINYILTPDNFAYLSAQYQRHAWLAILVAGFTPIPYKAATLTAGFCKLSFIPFVICSFIARGARFYLIALIIKFCGEHIKRSINRYFNLIVLATFATAVLIIWLLKQKFLYTGS